MLKLIITHSLSLWVEYCDSRCLQTIVSENLNRLNFLSSLSSSQESLGHTYFDKNTDWSIVDIVWFNLFVKIWEFPYGAVHIRCQPKMGACRSPHPLLSAQIRNWRPPSPLFIKKIWKRHTSPSPLVRNHIVLYSKKI